MGIAGLLKFALVALRPLAAVAIHYLLEDWTLRPPVRLRAAFHTLVIWVLEGGGLSFPPAGELDLPRGGACPRFGLPGPLFCPAVAALTAAITISLIWPGVACIDEFSVFS